MVTQERVLRRCEVASLIEAHHPLRVTYESLLVRCGEAANTPANTITTVGFEVEEATALEETLKTSITALGELVATSELDTSGLYIVKSPEADQAQKILGASRTGSGTHQANGIARIICVDRDR